MEKAFLFRKWKLKVKRKAEHIRNRQLQAGPLGRRSQGTRYIDAAGRDGPTHRRRWQREIQETRHELRLEGAWQDGGQKCSSLGGGEEMWHMFPLYSITTPRDLLSPAFAHQRLRLTFWLPLSGGRELKVPEI